MTSPESERHLSLILTSPFIGATAALHFIHDSPATRIGAVLQRPDINVSVIGVYVYTRRKYVHSLNLELVLSLD